MKLWKTLAVMTAVSGLCVCGACKKSEAPTAVTGDAIAQSVKNWDKSEVNALLGFVPADTPLVVMTTRSKDLSSLKAFYAQAGKTLDKSLSFLTEDETPDDALDKETLDLFQSYVALVKDPVAEGAKWGLDFAHTDSVVYIANDHFVAKMTVADSAKLQEKVDAFAKGTKDGSILTRKTLQVGTDPWVIYSMDPAIKDMLDLSVSIDSVAVHYGKDVVTMVLVSSDVKPEALAKMLQPAEKSLTKGAFKIGDEVSVGYIDNVRAFDMLVKLLQSAPQDDLPFDLSDVCVNEYKTMLSGYPRTDVKVSGDEKAVDVRYTLEMSDKAMLAKVKALHAETLSLATDKTIGAVNLSVNLGKTLALMGEMADQESKKTYQCESLTELQDTLKSAKTLSAMVAPYQKLIDNLTGVSVAVNQIDVSNPADMKIEAAVAVTGADVNKVVKDSVQTLGEFGEMAAAVLPVDDNVKSIDLKELADIPLTVDVFMNAQGIVAATAPFDVKALATGKMKPTTDFMRVYYSGKLLNTLSETEILPDGLGYEMSLGTSDDGVSFGIKVTLQ